MFLSWTNMDLSNEHYLNHLTEVNKQGKIILTEDVLNQNGVLVIKKGAEVNRELSYKIARHKLANPIDNSIMLSEQLSYQEILGSWTKQLDELSMLETAKSSEHYSAVLHAFNLLFKYPLLLQKLTILQQRLPEIFGKLLASSAMAFGLCKELKMSDEVTHNVFIANMMTDIGLLHINPELVNKKGKYSPQEWKLMQGHVAIAKHFADQITALPKRVSMALLEHHERNDGFGYPFGKKGEQRCIEGQILSMVDMLNGLSRKLIFNQSYSWRALLHVMQMPSTAHAPNVHNAMIRLLKKLDFAYKPAFKHDQYQTLAGKCLQKRKKLTLWFAEFEKIYVNHKQLLEESVEFDALGLLKKLEYTVHNTGLLNEAQHKWLSELSEGITPADYIELEEYVLLLDEIEFRCFFVLRKFISHKEILARRVGSLELLMAYHDGLTNILSSAE